MWGGRFAAPPSALLRALNFGTVGWAQLVNVGYLLILGCCGLFLAQRRIAKLLLK